MTIISTYYLINGTIFGKKVVEHKMCVLFVFNLNHFSFLEELSEILS